MKLLLALLICILPVTVNAKKLKLPKCEAGQTLEHVWFNKPLPNGSRQAVESRRFLCNEKGKWEEITRYQHGIRRK